MTGASAGGAPATGAFKFGTAAKLPGLRRDLKITPASVRGRASYVVKDPVSSKYFRWGEKEYRLAQLLDGRQEASGLIEEMRRSFPGQQFETEDLQRMVNQFLSAGLLATDGSTALRLVEHLKRAQQEKVKKSRWLTVPGKLISFKVTLFDPDLLLLRMNKRLGFLWSWPAAAALAAMVAFAAWMLTSDAANLASRMPDILGWENLLIMWVVLIVVKVVHEFGHGLSCKHYGGEVHEMGAMFILFSPFLFCNATDSWGMKEKWKRMVVTFGGIYLELFLAAAAAVLWVLTPPGFFNQVCFNVMFVCSVMTIFFNANPLMKYDGYYALSDWLEIPNLKERGDKTLVGRLASFFTGGAGLDRDPLAESAKWTVMTYAVASYVWTFVVAYGILMILGHMLEPAGLDRLAQTTAAITLFAGILAPPFLVCMQVFKTAKNDATGAVKRRALRAGIIAAVGLAVLSGLPVPVSVRSACVIDGSNRVRVTAESAGFLREIAVSDGGHVKKGDLLAVLENRFLEKESAGLELQLQAIRAQQSLAVSGEMEASIPELRALRAQYEAAGEKARKDVDALRIIAPAPGVVMAKGLRLRKGSLLLQGALLCEILPDGPLHAVVALSEREANMVRSGQSVSFRLHSSPGRKFSGEVVSVDVAPMRELPHQSLGQQAGGTVPSILATGADRMNTVALPASTIYEARVAVEDPRDLLRPGMSGRLKIDCGKKALGVALWDHVSSMIRTDFQL